MVSPSLTNLPKVLRLTAYQVPVSMIIRETIWSKGSTINLTGGYLVLTSIYLSDKEILRSCWKEGYPKKQATRSAMLSTAFMAVLFTSLTWSWLLIGYAMFSLTFYGVGFNCKLFGLMCFGAIMISMRASKDFNFYPISLSVWPSISTKGYYSQPKGIA